MRHRRGFAGTVDQVVFRKCGFVMTLRRQRRKLRNRPDVRTMSDSPLHSSDRSHLWIGAAILALTLLASIWFVRFIVATGDTLISDRLMSLVRTAAATLESDPIASLTGTPDDTGTPYFDAVREELRRAREVNPDFRFVYLMRPSVETPELMIFLADAESPQSPDYSAPGDLYDGPSEEIFLSYRTGAAMLQPAYADRWGHWVTALAPVRDQNGAILAVLGMDMRADFWLATQARYRNFALALVGLVLLLELLFLLGLHIQKANARQLAVLNGQLQRQLNELERAQARLRLADVVVQHTGEAVVVLDSDMHVISTNPGFSRITGYTAEAVRGKPLALFEEDDVIVQIRSRLQQSEHWDGTLWAGRAGGGRFPMEASLDVGHDAYEGAPRYVMVFRDVTVQKRLEDRLRELSATDALTLLANRRTFDETLEREWHRATRTGEPMSLMMIDVDHFKPYNDLYGHPAGDRCLQQIANALSTGVEREGALVARYGGEEFAIILPRTDTDAANTVAQTVRQRVEALGIPHKGHPTAGRVTISIGLSTRTPPQTSDFVALMQSADQALYQAKKHGRNAVAAD